MKLITLLFALVGISSSAVAANEKMMLRGVKNLPFLQEGAKPDRTGTADESGVCTEDADCGDGCNCDTNLADANSVCGAKGNKGCCLCWFIQPVTDATKPATTAAPVTGATAVIQTFPTDGDYLGDEDVVQEEEEVDEIRSEMNELLKVFPHLQGARHGFCQKNNDCGGNQSGCSCKKDLPTDQCDPPDTNPSSGCCVCE